MLPLESKGESLGICVDINNAGIAWFYLESKAINPLLTLNIFYYII